MFLNLWGWQISQWWANSDNYITSTGRSADGNHVMWLKAIEACDQKEPVLSPSKITHPMFEAYKSTHNGNTVNVKTAETVTFGSVQIVNANMKLFPVHLRPQDLQKSKHTRPQMPGKLKWNHKLIRLPSVYIELIAISGLPQPYWRSSWPAFCLFHFPLPFPIWQLQRHDHIVLCFSFLF